MGAAGLRSGPRRWLHRTLHRMRWIDRSCGIRGGHRWRCLPDSTRAAPTGLMPSQRKPRRPHRLDCRFLAGQAHFEEDPRPMSRRQPASDRERTASPEVRLGFWRRTRRSVWTRRSRVLDASGLGGARALPVPVPAPGGGPAGDLGQVGLRIGRRSNGVRWSRCST